LVLAFLAELFEEPLEDPLAAPFASRAYDEPTTNTTARRTRSANRICFISAHLL
jgi:hypothetical protein